MGLNDDEVIRTFEADPECDGVSQASDHILKGGDREVLNDSITFLIDVIVRMYKK